MLTVLRLFVPNLKDIHYSIMVEWCGAQSKYYAEKGEWKKCGYWSERMTKYLLKRIDLLHKRGII